MAKSGNISIDVTSAAAVLQAAGYTLELSPASGDPSTVFVLEIHGLSDPSLTASLFPSFYAGLYYAPISPPTGVPSHFTATITDVTTLPDGIHIEFKLDMVGTIFNINAYDQVLIPYGSYALQVTFVSSQTYRRVGGGSSGQPAEVLPLNNYTRIADSNFPSPSGQTVSGFQVVIQR